MMFDSGKLHRGVLTRPSAPEPLEKDQHLSSSSHESHQGERPLPPPRTACSGDSVIRLLPKNICPKICDKIETLSTHTPAVRRQNDPMPSAIPRPHIPRASSLTSLFSLRLNQRSTSLQSLLAEQRAEFRERSTQSAQMDQKQRVPSDPSLRDRTSVTLKKPPVSPKMAVNRSPKKMVGSNALHMNAHTIIFIPCTN